MLISLHTLCTTSTQFPLHFSRKTGPCQTQICNTFLCYITLYIIKAHSCYNHVCCSSFQINGKCYSPLITISLECVYIFQLHSNEQRFSILFGGILAKMLIHSYRCVYNRNQTHILPAIIIFLISFLYIYIILLGGAGANVSTCRCLKTFIQTSTFKLRQNWLLKFGSQGLPRCQRLNSD